jgi:hypothetical protein
MNIPPFENIVISTSMNDKLFTTIPQDTGLSLFGGVRIFTDRFMLDNIVVLRAQDMKVVGVLIFNRPEVKERHDNIDG